MLVTPFNGGMAAVLNSHSSTALFMIRDNQGFWNPWVMGRVSEGKGQGKDFHTLEKPLPLVGVKGIDWRKNRYITFIYLQKYIFPSEIFVYDMYEGILHEIQVL